MSTSPAARRLIKTQCQNCLSWKRGVDKKFHCKSPDANDRIGPSYLCDCWEPRTPTTTRFSENKEENL